jgi:hypothetical protein
MNETLKFAIKVIVVIAAVKVVKAFVPLPDSVKQYLP